MYISHKKVSGWNADKIKLLNITLTNKEHEHCSLLIKSSKNDVHRGLYCCNHKKWLQWITYEQEQTLKEMGIPAESIKYIDLNSL